MELFPFLCIAVCVSTAAAVDWQLWWLKCSFRPVPVGAGSPLWEGMLGVSQCELGIKTGQIAL